MKYKRTAIITLAGSKTHGLQTFESDSPLSDERVTKLVKESGVHRAVVIHVYDTPEPEVVRPKIVVQVATDQHRLYLGISTDGKWSPFWKLTTEMGRAIILDFMVNAHNIGKLDHRLDRDTHWLGDISLLTPIITYDGKQIVCDVTAMSDPIKSYLNLYRS